MNNLGGLGEATATAAPPELNLILVAPPVVSPVMIAGSGMGLNRKPGEVPHLGKGCCWCKWGDLLAVDVVVLLLSMTHTSSFIHCCSQ